MTPHAVRPFSAGDFPELDAVQTLIRRAGSRMRSNVVCAVQWDGEMLPVYCLELGTTDPRKPAVGFFGGVHGVERIGAQVLLSYLHSLIERLHWDDALGHLLDNLRLVFMPIVNPGGMLARTRATPAGIDLMRNAPISASERVPLLLGGQRLSAQLPWYRGPANAPMAPEAQALCAVVEERLLPHAFAITLDCHSGFGTRDHIWFPYAHTRRPIECLADIYALRSMFRSTHPYHSIYSIGPQARHYMTHGDLWDHLYLRARERGSHFIPLTLELGSWLWLKKSPLQIFNLLGLFNPVLPHRHQRTLRQHLVFMDFLVRAALSHERWRPPEAARAALHEAAVAYWYAARPAAILTQPAH
jgi:hypothetical protein